MFSPLDIDRRRSMIAPIGVDDLAVPVRPQIRRRVRRVVTDPDDFFVRGDGKWDSRSIDVILPQQVVGDDRPLGMDHSDDPGQREPLVTLHVQNGGELSGELGDRIGCRKSTKLGQRRVGDVRMRSAGSKAAQTASRNDKPHYQVQSQV